MRLIIECHFLTPNYCPHKTADKPRFILMVCLCIFLNDNDINCCVEELPDLKHKCRSLSFSHILHAWILTSYVILWSSFSGSDVETTQIYKSILAGAQFILSKCTSVLHFPAQNVLNVLTDLIVTYFIHWNLFWQFVIKYGKMLLVTLRKYMGCSVKENISHLQKLF